MVQVRVGVDLVEVAHLARLLGEHEQAADELFTVAEQAYCGGKRRRMEHLAARFAAKEAVFKALGTGVRRHMRWTEIEIVNTTLGRPVIRLSGAVAARAAGWGVDAVDVSLTHTGDLAIAHAVVVRGGSGGSFATKDGTRCDST